MKKATFLTYEKPLLTCMVQADNPERIEELIKKALPEGAEAFGMQICRLLPTYRNPETYRRLFLAAKGLPVYVTNYRYCENEKKSDDVLADELCELAKCGATLCDMMGDYFDRVGIEGGEFTTDPVSVERQMRLVDRLHANGAEVLMSSHIMKFTPAERVLEIALAHQSRGADISKIVVGAENAAQQIENLRIINLLKENLKIPFLFLSGGECRILRRIGGALGNCMTLCVYEHDALSTPAQPLLSDVRTIRELL